MLEENDVPIVNERLKNTYARKMKRMEPNRNEGSMAEDNSAITSAANALENDSKRSSNMINELPDKIDMSQTISKTHGSSNANGGGNDTEFERITQNIYQVIRANGGRLLMSQIASKYQETFGKPLNFDGNPKYFRKREEKKTVLIVVVVVGQNRSDDVMLYYTPEPAYKLVVSILKQNAGSAGTGLLVSEFREQLEQRMGMTLSGCDFMLFTPHSGSTVFFGNLNVSCTEEDIYEDLEKVDPAWRHASVRLKLGKGFSYAFVLSILFVSPSQEKKRALLDFPTRGDAMRAVEHFDDKAAFKSKNVSADIEAIEQRKRYHSNNSKLLNLGSPLSQGNVSTPIHGIDMTNDNNVNSTTNSAKMETSVAKGIEIANSNNNENVVNRNDNIDHPKKSSNRKVTVYLGNLRDSVTKLQILNGLAEIRPEWRALTTRLNLRSGWSHAFVG
ncbi:hypothetical protein RFI_02576 [Reticulomyxa filosa]|uniref:RRM domain-containing protein n=1 Tax=Reticulomyxa filosa TaxID=46433 RepID=X6P8J2_RETFI|nr:hypothetical protein RFI_02576 [Reticulomyxa filosa]|eukprot:ETO34516.1 hypothetical protein RFI_02576 [Reticulomyxa filosa]